MVAQERVPIAAQDSERPVLAEVVRLLREPRAATTVSAGKMTLVLPASALILVRQMVEALANGDAVTFVPVHKELTTQQVAGILNVSRTHVLSLLDKGEIPFVRPHNHRRIRFDDLMTYKRKRDAEQGRALAALTQINQDLGLYDDDVEPQGGG